MENINEILIMMLKLNLALAIFLPILLLHKVSKLIKRYSCLSILLSMCGYVMFFIIMGAILFHTHRNMNKLVCMLFSFFSAAQITNYYGISKRHLLLITLTLLIDSIAMFFQKFLASLVNLEVVDNWLYIVSAIEFLLVIINIATINRLNRMNSYGFIYIHDKRYPVYNDLDIQFGKDKEYYRTIYIPIVGSVELGGNPFIKNSDDDNTEYTIQIGYDEYEIRSDKEIKVENIKGIIYIVITVNQTALAVQNDRMKNILV